MWRKCVSLLNNLLSKTLSILPKTKEQVLLGEQEPNMSSWGKYLSYNRAENVQHYFLTPQCVSHPYSNIVKCRLLPQGLYIFISGLGGLINGKAYIQGEGCLKPEQKKRFETRNGIADKNTFCILFYWILFKLQNVKINQVYFNAFGKELISEWAYNQMCFFAYRYSVDGPITGVREGEGWGGLQATGSLRYCILCYRPKTNWYVMTCLFTLTTQSSWNFLLCIALEEIKIKDTIFSKTWQLS